MISQGKNTPADPIKLLVEQYFKPSHLSAKQYALSAGISPTRFREVIAGKSKLTSDFIEKISKLTKTCSKFWYLLLLEHEYHRHQVKKGRNISIKPIRHLKKKGHLKALFAKVAKGSPGEQLLQRVILPEKISINALSKRLQVDLDVIIKLLKGEEEVDIELACKLGTIFLNPHFWLKLQMSFEINQALGKKNLPANLQNQLKQYDRRLHREIDFQRKYDCQNPAQVLKDKYLNPSGVKFCDWCQLFCLSKRRMNSILSGRTLLPLEMIFKFNIIFDTPLDFWLNLRLRYAIKKASLITSQRRNRQRRDRSNAIQKHVESKPKPNNLGKVLVNDYLQPLNWQIHEFAKHIGVRRSKFYSLIQGTTIIDFDLATRLGMALEMNPRYWLYLQLDRSIKYNQKLPIF